MSRRMASRDYCRHRDNVAASGGVDVRSRELAVVVPWKENVLPRPS